MGGELPRTRLAQGDVVAGRFVVERLLGEGGMGVVVAARRLALDDRVALKLLRTETAGDPEAVARFVREGRSSARIRSEHVARVLEVGEAEGGAPYLVMELLEGEDLGSLVDRAGPLPIEFAAELVLQACSAIAEAHALGIVHRDVKPSNLFLTRRQDGSPLVKVLDFGISKSLEFDRPDFGMTQTQAVMGSPQYMAPEQMRSSRRADHRADIWSLGAVLYELLAGRPPYDAATIAELFAMILRDPVPPLTSLRADVPAALQSLVEACLSKAPEDRPRSVPELARALQPFATKTAHSQAFDALQARAPIATGSLPRAIFETMREPTGFPSSTTRSDRGRTGLLRWGLAGGSMGLALVGLVLIGLAARRPPRPAAPLVQEPAPAASTMDVPPSPPAGPSVEASAAPGLGATASSAPHTGAPPERTPAIPRPPVRPSHAPVNGTSAPSAARAAASAASTGTAPAATASSRYD